MEGTVFNRILFLEHSNGMVSIVGYRPLFADNLMSATLFPISLYEELLPKVVDVLELTQQTEGLTNQQAKQKLLHAVSSFSFSSSTHFVEYNQTNTFRYAISQAKDIAVKLPGGELTIEQQDGVIKLLESLRERKRYQSYISFPVPILFRNIQGSTLGICIQEYRHLDLSGPVYDRS